MAYDKTKLYEKSIDLIKKHNLFFIEDIVALLPCCKAIFYDYFQVGSNELNTLKDLLEENKVKVKTAIRGKLFKGKGMELIALYKLCANKEELAILSNNINQREEMKLPEIKIEVSTPEMSETMKKALELINSKNETK